MKLYARITNEKGKTDGMGADEMLTTVITIGNKIVAELHIQSGHFRFWQDGSLKEWNEEQGTRTGA